MGGKTREADGRVFWLCRTTLEGQKQATERHHAHAVEREALDARASLWAPASHHPHCEGGPNAVQFL